MKSRFWGVFFLICFFLLLTPQAKAREWTILGPRALGMGGAHVAVVNDSTASYWNPAAYGFFGGEEKENNGKRDCSSVIYGGVGGQVHEDLSERLDRILDYDYDLLDTGQISAESVADYVGLINELQTFNDNKDRAVMVIANAGISGQMGHFGVGGHIFAEVSGSGWLDLVNIAPVESGIIYDLDDFTDPANFGYAGTSGVYTYYDQPGNPSSGELFSYLTTTLGWTDTQAQNFTDATDFGLTQTVQSGETIPSDILGQIQNVASLADTTAGAGGSFADNDSLLLFKGMAVTEIPITYGHAITKNLAIGGNIKFMKARVYNSSIQIFDVDDFKDALDDATKDYKESQNFGVDLGVLYRLGDDLRVGIVGRNLNSPEFDVEQIFLNDDDTIEEKIQARAGVAYKPLSSLTLALDMDLTKNETTLSGGYDSQNIGGGIELNLFKILNLRGGAYENIAESDIGVVYTAGLGLNLWLINLDIGASMASKSSEIDGDDIPKEAKVMLALSMLF